MSSPRPSQIDQIRHDLRTLGSLLFALRAGLDRIDNLDPDMTALCDGATTRLQSIIDSCHAEAPEAATSRRARG